MGYIVSMYYSATIARKQPQRKGNEWPEHCCVPMKLCLWTLSFECHTLFMGHNTIFVMNVLSPLKISELFLT